MAEEKNGDKYIPLQLLQQQLGQLTEYLEKLQLQQQELVTSLEALTELQKTKINTEILAPVANGIFLKAELKNHPTPTLTIPAKK